MSFHHTKQVVDSEMSFPLAERGLEVAEPSKAALVGSYLRATGFFSALPLWTLLLLMQVFLSGAEIETFGPVSFGSPVPVEFLSAILIAATVALTCRWASPAVFSWSWRVLVVRAGSLFGSLTISALLLVSPGALSQLVLVLPSIRNFLLTLSLCLLFSVFFGRAYSWLAAAGMFSVPLVAIPNNNPLSLFGLTLSSEVSGSQWILVFALLLPSVALWLRDPLTHELLRANSRRSFGRFFRKVTLRKPETWPTTRPLALESTSDSPKSSSDSSSSVPRSFLGFLGRSAFLFRFYARNSNLVFALFLVVTMHITWIVLSPKLWAGDEIATLAAVTAPLTYSGPILSALVAIDTARFVKGHRFLTRSSFRGPHRDSAFVYGTVAVSTYFVLTLTVFLAVPPVHFSLSTLLAVLTNALFICLFCIVGAVVGSHLPMVFAGLAGAAAGYFLVLQASIPLHDRFTPFDFDFGANYYAGTVLSVEYLAGQAAVLCVLLVGLWLFPVIQEPNLRALFRPQVVIQTVAFPTALVVFAGASVLLPVERTPNDPVPPTNCSPLLRGELCLYPEMERVRPVLTIKINTQLEGLITSPFEPLLPEHYWVNWRAETPAGTKGYFLQSHEEDPTQIPFTYSLYDSVLWASCSAFQQHPDVRSGKFLEDPLLVEQFDLVTQAFDYYALSHIDSAEAQAQLSYMEPPSLVLAEVEPLLKIIGSCASD